MKKQQIELHIKRAISDLTPDVFDRIVDISFQRAEQEKETGEQGFFECLRKRQIRRRRTLAAACLIFLCVFSVGAYLTLKKDTIATTILMDVNPSFELEVNQKDRVITALPLNDEANVVLQSLDLLDVDYNTAIQAIIGAVISNGFMTGTNLTTLITVKNEDPQKAETIKNSIQSTIQTSMQGQELSYTVFQQNPNFDETVTQLAETYQISLSKAQLCAALLQKDGNLNQEILVDLSIEELITIAAGSGLDLSDILEYEEGEYTPIQDEMLIGFEKAASIAKERAGGGLVFESELEYEQKYWQYSITLLQEGYEYEYKIHAYTGEVIKEEKEQSDQEEDKRSEPMAGSYLSMEEALSLVKEEMKETGDLMEWEFEDGIYEFLFRVGTDAHEYLVDALTKTVTLEEIEQGEFSIKKKEKDFSSKITDAASETFLPTTKPTVSVKDSKPAEPTITESPIITKDPAITEEIVTQKPDVTQKPIVTQKPDVTEKPIVTQKPMITQKPTATEKPVATKAPTPTPKHSTTQAPTIENPSPFPTVTEEAKMLTEQEATALVLTKGNQGIVNQIQYEDGYYEITLRVGEDEYEYLVNAYTSEILLKEINYEEYKIEEEDREEDSDKENEEDDDNEEDEEDD